ncbi:GntR family transcriptional regulator [Pseudonocardia sp. H11422]|uniref:GntR family transcriptional regulator n=1 Tax=Pseudonocardia sp. H11422 TaxID=2835866 RepID=UPI001BDC3266|nr:GntR family transcriptional regulator [Pseudonocardia sp. H11422]
MTRDTVPAKDRAYRYTKDGVLEGRFAGGELISEGQVADALQMSRTPVREAFLRLEAEGLLRLFPKRGALVVPVSPQEVDAVLEARELVEGHAMAKILLRPPAVRMAAVERLRDLLAEQTGALEAGDERVFVDADRRFHSVIVGEAGNPILLDLYESLRDRQLRMGLGALGRDPNRAREIVEQHACLVALIESGDGAGFRSVLLGHLDGTRSALLGGSRPG